MIDSFRRLGYILATHTFHLGFYVDKDLYLFPRRLVFEVTHIPTGEDMKAALKGETAAVYMTAELSFRYGFLWRRSATLAIYKHPNPFAPSFWRWMANGENTPGFVVEDMERSYFLRRDAMNARMQGAVRP